uniref:NADH dehydrogenase [ubiquinone] 1 beta subcomplex subunit 1 n=1 Tax=Myxine glutinosa TaxID=7769 RepID=UPI003590213A
MEDGFMEELHLKCERVDTHRTQDETMLQLIREFWPVGFLPLGFFIGSILDRHFDSQLASYRNKSRMYRRELRENETETWK